MISRMKEIYGSICRNGLIFYFYITAALMVLSVYCIFFYREESSLLILFLCIETMYLIVVTSLLEDANRKNDVLLEENQLLVANGDKLSKENGELRMKQGSGNINSSGSSFGKKLSGKSPIKEGRIVRDITFAARLLKYIRCTTCMDTDISREKQYLEETAGMLFRWQAKTARTGSKESFYLESVLSKDTTETELQPNFQKPNTKHVRRPKTEKANSTSCQNME